MTEGMSSSKASRTTPGMFFGDGRSTSAAHDAGIKLLRTDVLTVEREGHELSISFADGVKDVEIRLDGMAFKASAKQIRAISQFLNDKIRSRDPFAEEEGETV